MLKVLFLDWYKTLSDSIFWQHVLGSDHPLSRPFRTVQKAVFGRPGSLINDWMRGFHSLEDVVDLAADESGVASDLILKELQYSCEHMQLVSDQIPALVSRFRRCRVRVVIATDNMDTFDRWTVPALQLDRLFDGICNSYNLRCLKGDRSADGSSSFFTPLLRMYDVIGQETALIDDSRDVDYLHTELGMNLITIPSSGSLVPAMQRLLKEVE
jgi:hypothetical protein